GLFVKQIREMQPDATLTLRREAACYELARDDAALSRLMPQLITYDPVRHLLIVELLPDAESIAERNAREKIIPAEIGGMLGEGLGLYHAHAGCITENDQMRSLFARHMPALLRLRAGGLAALGQWGKIGPAVSAVMQQHPELQNLLDAIGAEW